MSWLTSVCDNTKHNEFAETYFPNRDSSAFLINAPIAEDQSDPTKFKMAIELDSTNIKHVCTAYCIKTHLASTDYEYSAIMHTCHCAKPRQLCWTTCHKSVAEIDHRTSSPIKVRVFFCSLHKFTTSIEFISSILAILFLVTAHTILPLTPHSRAYIYTRGN